MKASVLRGDNLIGFHCDSVVWTMLCQGKLLAVMTTNRRDIQDVIVVVSVVVVVVVPFFPLPPQSVDSDVIM